MATQHVAVFSAHRYRAESVALALSGRGYNAQPFTRLDLEVIDRFGIVLVDLDAGVDSTLEFIRTITMRQPHAKVVVLGLPESEESVVKLAEAGASGYASPCTSSDELAAILRSVQDGEFSCPPNITYALFFHLAHLAKNRVLVPWQISNLTAREQKVLELLSRNLTNKEIAECLCISRCTAKNHVHRILRKLRLRKRSQVSPLLRNQIHPFE